MIQRVRNISNKKLEEIITGLAFGKLNKLLPVKRIIETEKTVSFHHPHPNYEMHVVIVPKKAIKNLHHMKEHDYEYLQDMISVARHIIKKFALGEKYYKLIINGGSTQKIKQLHMHLVSGKELI